VRIVFTFLCCLLGSQAIAQSQTSDADLLTAEQRDARLREQQELEARASELEAQQQTTRELLDQQEQYLDALRAQIKAMKASDNAPAPANPAGTPP